MKNILIGLIIIVIVGAAGVGVYNATSGSSDKVYENVSKITYTDALTQTDLGNGYFVYYYQEDCQYCIELNPTLNT